MHARVVSCDAVRRAFVGGCFVGALALFVYVVTRQPLGSIAEACGAMGPLVLLSPVIACTWLVTRSAVLGNALTGAVPWRTLLPIRLVGDGYNALVPAAGLAGEPYKLRALARWVTVERALAALLRDRLIDNALGLLFSAAGIAVGLARFAGLGLLWTYVAVAAPAGVVMLAIACTRVPDRLGGVARRWTRASRHAPEPLPRQLALRAVMWALATRILQTLETALLLACIGAPVSVASVALVDGVLNAAGFVGFLMPQGLGVVEGAAIYALGALGTPAASATAFALTRRGRVLIVGGLGVATHVLRHARQWLRVPQHVR